MSGRKGTWAARIDPQIAERVRGTIVGLQRLDPSFTAGLFTEQALVAWCEQMENDHNAGRPWTIDAPNARLRPGPRMQ